MLHPDADNAARLPDQDEPSPAPDILTPEPAPEPVVAEPETDPLAGVATQLASLDERLEESQRLLSRQTDLVERLHAENQRLRNGEVRAAQLPLVRDLLRLHDDLGRLVEAAGDAAPDLGIVRTSLLDALARNGILPFDAKPGSEFDSRRQSAAGVVPSDDASLDRHVAETVRAGFGWDDGELIRVADVRVYRHVPAPIEDTPTAATAANED